MFLHWSFGTDPHQEAMPFFGSWKLHLVLHKTDVIEPVTGKVPIEFNLVHPSNMFINGQYVMTDGQSMCTSWRLLTTC